MDKDHDIGRQAPSIRRQNLFNYMRERMVGAKHLLLAEAIGYQGGRFRGIAMTSERILLGGLTGKGILPEHVFAGARPQRTSGPDLKPKGFSEPTATIVWTEIVKLGRPKDFILWNAFPWHPYDPGLGLLSNRTPSVEELGQGEQILVNLLHITRVKSILALGRKAKILTHEVGIGAVPLRHPARGGAAEFARQFAAYLRPAEKG